MFFNKFLCKPNLNFTYRAILLKLCISILSVPILVGNLFYTQTVYAKSDATHTISLYHTHTGSSSTGKGCYSTPVYHYHSGDSINGGGCYSVPEYRTCGGSGAYDGTSSDEIYCTVCGRTIYDGPYYNDYLGTSCNARILTGYSLGCGKGSYHVEHYNLGCGKNTTTPIGSFTVDSQTTDWVKELTLDISFDGIDDYIDTSHPFSVNDVLQEQSPYVVTENGDYTVKLNVNFNINNGDAAISLNITNIDNTSPTIGDYKITLADDLESSTLTLIDVADTQPDGSDGCGLHETAYSYDNGATWTSQTSHIYTENGPYTVKVRDVLGNETSLDITISGIVHPTPAPDDNGDSNYGDNDDSSNAGDSDTTNNNSGHSSDDDKSISDVLSASAKTTPTLTPTPSQNSYKQTLPVVVDEPSDEVSVTPYITPVPTKRVIIPKEELISDTESVVEEIENNDCSEQDMTLLQIILLILATALAVFLLLFILFALLRCTLVYCYKGKNNYKFVGISFIRHSTDSYELNISQSIIDSCDTASLRLKFPPLFILLHSNSDVVVYLPGGASQVVHPLPNVNVDIK